MIVVQLRIEDLVLPFEGVADCRNRITRRRVQRLQNGAQDGEGVLIEARPDMQPMLLDSLAVVGIAPAGGLAAETPAELVQRDLVFFALRVDFAQRDSGAQRAHSAAQNRHAYFASSHVQAPAR